MGTFGTCCLYRFVVFKDVFLQMGFKIGNVGYMFHLGFRIWPHVRLRAHHGCLGVRRRSPKIGFVHPRFQRKNVDKDPGYPGPCIDTIIGANLVHLTRDSVKGLQHEIL